MRPEPKKTASQVNLELCGVGSTVEASASEHRRCSAFAGRRLGDPLEEGGLALPHTNTECRRAVAPSAPAQLVEQ
jgi:hypothetical protein